MFCSGFWVIYSDFEVKIFINFPTLMNVELAKLIYETKFVIPLLVNDV